jgi:hypothetical protein
MQSAPSDLFLFSQLAAPIAEWKRYFFRNKGQEVDDLNQIVADAA